MALQPRICLDVFTISLLLNIECHLEISASDKIKTFHVLIGRSYDFEINFMYILGTDYDTEHVNFGFSAEYPTGADPTEVLQNGVSVENQVFMPAMPDTSHPPNEIQVCVYFATVTFTSDQTIFDALVALATVGEARFNHQFGGVLKYNQGVT